MRSSKRLSLTRRKASKTLAKTTTDADKNTQGSGSFEQSDANTKTKIVGCVDAHSHPVSVVDHKRSETQTLVDPKSKCTKHRNTTSASASASSSALTSASESKFTSASESASAGTRKSMTSPSRMPTARTTTTTATPTRRISRSKSQLTDSSTAATTKTITPAPPASASATSATIPAISAAIIATTTSPPTTTTAPKIIEATPAKPTRIVVVDLVDSSDDDDGDNNYNYNSNNASNTTSLATAAISSTQTQKSNFFTTKCMPSAMCTGHGLHLENEHSIAMAPSLPEESKPTQSATKATTIATTTTTAMTEMETGDTETPQLDEHDAYRTHFCEILNTITNSNNLLSPSEINIQESFRALSDDAQTICVRLLQRKGPWFLVNDVRSRYLTEKNIEDLTSSDRMENAIEALTAAGIFQTFPPTIGSNLVPKVEPAAATADDAEIPIKAPNVGANFAPNVETASGKYLPPSAFTSGGNLPSNFLTSGRIQTDLPLRYGATNPIQIAATQTTKRRALDLVQSAGLPRKRARASGEIQTSFAPKFGTLSQDDLTLSDALQVIATCLSVVQLRKLLVQLGGNCNASSLSTAAGKGSRSSGRRAQQPLNRSQIVQRVTHLALNQRTVFGKRLPVAKAVVTLLRSSGTNGDSKKKRKYGKFSAASTFTSTSSSKFSSSKQQAVAMRFTHTALNAFRRSLMLHYADTRTELPFISLWVYDADDAGITDVDNLSDGGSCEKKIKFSAPASDLREPYSTSSSAADRMLPGLLARFNLVCYPSFTQCGTCSLFEHEYINNCDGQSNVAMYEKCCAERRMISSKPAFVETDIRCCASDMAMDGACCVTNTEGGGATASKFASSAGNVAMDDKCCASPGFGSGGGKQDMLIGNTCCTGVHTSAETASSTGVSTSEETTSASVATSLEPVLVEGIVKSEESATVVATSVVVASPTEVATSATHNTTTQQDLKPDTHTETYLNSTEHMHMQPDSNSGTNHDPIQQETKVGTHTKTPITVPTYKHKQPGSNSTTPATVKLLFQNREMFIRFEVAVLLRQRMRVLEDIQMKEKSQCCVKTSDMPLHSQSIEDARMYLPPLAQVVKLGFPGALDLVLGSRGSRIDSLAFVCAIYLEQHETEFSSEIDGAPMISSLLASSVRRAVSLLESAKRYTEALDLLGRVLHCNGRLHDRGYLWNRMTVNFVHVGEPDLALSACVEGIEDLSSSYKGGAVLSLRRRLQRLQNTQEDKKNKNKNKNKNRSKKNENNNMMEIVNDKSNNNNNSNGKIINNNNNKNNKDASVSTATPCPECGCLSALEAKRLQLLEVHELLTSNNPTPNSRDHTGVSHKDYRNNEEHMGTKIEHTGNNMAYSRTCPGGVASETDPRKKNRNNGEHMGTKIEHNGTNLELGLIPDKKHQAIACNGYDVGTVFKEGSGTEFELERTKSELFPLIPHTLESIWLDSHAKQLEESVPVIVINARPMNRKAGEKSRFATNADTVRVTASVECLALEHLGESEGWQGLHSEGYVVRALFTLLLWDVLFLKAPFGAFMGPYQRAPKDLYAPGGQFLKRRYSIIRSHIHTLSHTPPLALATRVADSWLEHYGQDAIGIKWDQANLKCLQAAAACIGGHALGGIFTLLCLDYAYWRSGLPDLLLCRVRVIGNPIDSYEQLECFKDAQVVAEEGGRALADSVPWSIHYMNSWETFESQFVEVKGPRDTLSDKQLVWLNVLIKSTAAAVVLRVKESEKSTKKTKVKGRVKERKLLSEVDSDSDSDDFEADEEEEEEDVIEID